MRIHTSSTIAAGLAITFLFLAAGRWYEASVASPDRIPGFDRPSAILLVQARDCPDRSAATAAWLRSQGPGPHRIPIHLGVIGDEPVPLAADLEPLPRLGTRAVDAAVRAVLRSGLSGTPALLVLDELGRVLLTDTFERSGSGSRLALAAKLLPTLHAASHSGGTAPREGR